MLELTGLGSVLRGLGVLYWLLAIGLLFLALKKGRDLRRKLIWACVVVAVFGFLPAKAAIEKYRHDAYAKEAWAYFKKLCAEKSGEKIYKTFTGVKSVLVIKPLPPATEKDLYDQYWFGDPYSASATDTRGKHAAGKLVYPDASIAMNVRGKGFDFVESYVDHGTNYQYLVRVIYAPAIKDYVQQLTDAVVSQFGIAWEDISTAEDRNYWIAGSRLRVVKLDDNSVVAERIGYFIESGFGSVAGGRRPWIASKGPSTTCPYSHDWADRWFLVKVFQLQGDNDHGK